MKKKIIIILIILFALISITLAVRYINDKTNSKYNFEVTALSVGKADSIILKTENHCILIDCGEKDDGENILNKLKEKKIEAIDCLVITHFDKDHIGGAVDVLKGISVDKIYVPDYQGTSDEYKDYIKYIKKQNIAQTVLTEEISFNIDDVLISIYPPQEKEYEESDNDFSLALAAEYKNNSFLFCGDAEKVRLEEIKKQTGKEFDYIKVAHHGRYNKGTDGFFEATKPKYAVISTDEKNPPDEKTILILNNLGVKIYSTKDGDITAKSDGERIIIN